MTKLRLIFGIFILSFLIVSAKLFYLQVINPISSDDNGILKTRRIMPTRGKIYDSNGLPLALNQTTYLLYAEPKKIENTGLFVSALDSILKLGSATLEAKIDQSKNWVAITTIDKKQKEVVTSLNLKGAGFENRDSRFYPEGSSAAHLLGFVGKNTIGENIGYFGIEGYYNRDLTGIPGILKTERDLLNRPILLGTQEQLDPENGRDLYLTVDKSVQEIIKKRLKNALVSYQASAGCVIVADPTTMAILGLSCLPDFDVEKYYQFSESYFTNPAISNLYEPGSIFKPLIVAAALEENKIKPQDIYNETGPVQVGEYQIKTWNNRYEGEINMTRILEKSSNVGMVYIGEKLGHNLIYKYLEKFGFGNPTGIDLQGETGGFLKPKSSWYPIDFATVTFGQGIAVTPIQMIRAFASIINGGKLLKPFVVTKAASGNKKMEVQPKVVRNTISELTSQVIKKMLVSTVENGEVKWAAPAGYTIGGKTGTAQIPIAGRYDPSKTIASFIGFAPFDNPKFIVLTMLREPKTSPWGSETAAPLFFEIAKELFVYYNIAPQ